MSEGIVHVAVGQFLLWLPFGRSRQRFIAFLQAGVQELTHFGLFRFRLFELCWAERVPLCLLLLSVWDALRISL